jgi:hypothetical protein
MRPRQAAPGPAREKTAPSCPIPHSPHQGRARCLRHAPAPAHASQRRHRTHRPPAGPPSQQTGRPERRTPRRAQARAPREARYRLRPPGTVGPRIIKRARFPAGLSFCPCVRSARTPRSLPSRPGGAVSPYGRMGRGVQRRQRDGGQAAEPAAVRWPAAARSAAGQIEKPTCSASLPLLSAGRPGPGRPALMCGTSYRLELCISGVADTQVGAQPGMSRCLRGATRSAAR